jgi:hypothetical protein
MQELHCRPLFQVDSPFSRVDPSCQKVMNTEFDHHKFKHLLHKNPDSAHDSTELWPKKDTDSIKPKYQDLFNGDFLKLSNSKFMGILGLSLMGAMIVLSVVKSFLPK